MRLNWKNLKSSEYILVINSEMECDSMSNYDIIHSIRVYVCVDSKCLNFCAFLCNY